LVHGEVEAECVLLQDDLGINFPSLGVSFHLVTKTSVKQDHSLRSCGKGGVCIEIIVCGEHLLPVVPLVNWRTAGESGFALFRTTRSKEAEAGGIAMGETSMIIALLPPRLGVRVTVDV
jgi:hypothetical protein